MRRLLLSGISLVLLLSATAMALPVHLSVSKTFPATGTTITETPSHLQVWFSQAPTLAVSALSLEGPKGKVELGKVALGQSEGKADRSLVASIGGSLQPGKYTATWKTSGSDGHMLNGTFEFTLAPAK